ncbi:MAG: hypothetical protein ACFCU3_02250 [Verrucomicrobiales bacterium]
MSIDSLPPLKHAWRECVCIGRAAEILTSSVQEQLRLLQKQIGYRHIRFHASLHDELGVVADNGDGSVRYHWALVDQIYDFLVEIGFDPIVELNPMPSAIASGKKTFFDYKMNITPPRDWRDWEQLSAALAAHFVERYGLHRVRRWLFEVWNEPNLSGSFWTGTQEDYFQLYAASVRGIKSIDSLLRVGGPACAGTSMALPFARWCREHDVPVDFLSTHNYPMDEYGIWPRREGSPHAPGRAFIDAFQQCREELDAAGFEHLPNYVTEWNVQHCCSEGKAKWVGTSDCSRLFSAAAALHYAVETDPYVDALGYWTANDSMREAAVTSEPFGQGNQYYGMLTIQGIPKPVFHAFHWLGRMNGPQLPLVPKERPGLAGGLITDETLTTRALLWNFNMPLMASDQWRGELSLPVPTAWGEQKELYVITAMLTAGAGSLYELWLAMGSPVTLSRLEQDALTAASAPRHHALRLPVENNLVRLPFHLEADEVLFAEISPPRLGPAPSSTATEDNVAKLNRALQYPGVSNG